MGIAQTEAVGYGGRYEVVRRGLTDHQIIDLSAKINDSELFEFEKFSHVVLRDTNTIVGYIGNETAELCFPEQGKYKLPHLLLKRIFLSV